MWILREKLAAGLIALLVLGIAVRTWYIGSKLDAVTTLPPKVVDLDETIRQEPLSEYLFLVQARLLVGAKQFFHDMATQSGTAVTAESERSIEATLSSSLRSVNLAATRSVHDTTPAQRFDKRFIERKQVILSHFFNARDTEHPESVFSDPDRTPGEQDLDEVIQHALSSTESAPFSLAEQNLVVERLGWFGELLSAHAVSERAPDAPNKNDVTPTIFVEAKNSFMRFLIGLFVFLGAMVFGFIALVVIVTAFSKNRTTWHFTPPTIRPALALETFALYLIAMFGLSHLAAWLLPRGLGNTAAKLFGQSAPLSVNAIAIVFTLLVMLWPIFWGERWREVRRSFGIFTESFTRFYQDILLAPTTYLASWIILIVILFGYGMAVDALGIDMSQGAHPVVPLLLKSHDPSVTTAVLILAAIIAPIIEEIFFRGALYGYMRTRLNRWTAILLSSLIFAVIHPQGMVGVVPLTCIGCVLAFLREWRGSLVAPMIAHACFNGVTLLIILGAF